MKMTLKNKIIFISMILLLIASFGLMISNPFQNELITDAIVRTLYSIIILEIIWSLDIPIFHKQPSHHRMSALFMIIPALLVTINNFPWLAFFKGYTTLNQSATDIFYFIFYCISVGLFEELIFRGLILSWLLDYFKSKKFPILKAMLLSSLLFAFLHIFNLFSGASPMTTLLQISYTFLTGLLWSAIFILTKQLIYPIILHAGYNIAGLLFPTLGTITGQFDIWTIWITIIIGVFTGLYYLYLILKKEKIWFSNKGL